MKLAIKGHPKRGNEVIEILEMLGGINKLDLKGTEDYSHYYVGNSINKIYRGLGICLYDYIIYSLEEFLEKFPYKVGDKVQHKGATSCGSIFEVEKMRWEENTVKYTLCLFGCNYKRFTLPAEYLQPYKEETMEEINIDRIGFNGNKAKLILPDGYEFKTEGKDAYIIKKKPQYPKTYEECCEAIGINRYDIEIDLPQTYQQKMFNLFKLLICRDAYWKIAGEQMRLEKSWELDWNDCAQHKFGLYTLENEISCINLQVLKNIILVFPTEEMRDKFYENFKDLIEQCKELL